MNKKRIIKAIFLTLLILMLIVLAFLYFNKEYIIDIIIDEVELQTNTKITYKSTSLDIIDKFPNLLLSATDLDIRPSELDTDFVHIAKISIQLNPIQIIFNKEDPIIQSLIFNSPDISLIKFSDGLSNWQSIVETDSKEQNPSSQRIRINKIEVTKGEVKYLDELHGLSYVINNLEYNGKIALRNQTLDHRGEGHFSINSVNSSFINSKGYDISLKSHVSHDLKSEIYIIDESSILINELVLNMGGTFDSGDKQSYEIMFHSADQNFSNLLSIVQNLRKDIAPNLTANGNFSVEGSIKGELGNTTIYPIYSIGVNTENGSFVLPEVSSEETKVDINLSVRNTNVDFPFTNLNIESFEISKGHEYIKGTADIIQYDETIEVNYNLVADINDIANFNTLTEQELISGDINILSTGDFDLSAIEKNHLNDLEFSIDWESENVKFLMLDSTMVSYDISEGKGTEKKITLNFKNFQYGNSDINGEAIIKKPLNYLANIPSVEMALIGRSKFIDANQFSTDNEVVDTNIITPVFSGGFDIKADLVHYQSFPIEKLNLTAAIKEDKLTIDNVSGRIGLTDFNISGALDNMNAYLKGEEILTGTLDISSEKFDLAELESIYYDTTNFSRTGSSSTLFENMDIRIISSSNEISYNQSILQNNLASIKLSANKLLVNDFTSNSFGGKLNIEGDVVFNSLKTDIKLSTNFSNISIAQSLSALPIFKKLAYPLSFIDGRINTTMTLASAIDPKYNLILSEINAFALVETIEGKLVGFKPSEILQKFIGIKKTTDLVIRKSKNWVTISDGWVQVEEFKFRIDDYKFKVKGAHSLENDLDYLILVEVPASKLSKVNLEDHVKPELIAKLNKYRSVGKGYVGLYFEMNGNINNPVLSLNEIDIISAGKALVDQTIQEVKDTIQSRVDSVRNEVEAKIRDTVNVLIEKAEDKTSDILDSVKVIIKEEAEEHIDSLFTDQLDSIGSTIFDDKISLDSLKDKIIKLKDIFKKKN